MKYEMTLSRQDFGSSNSETTSVGVPKLALQNALIGMGVFGAILLIGHSTPSWRWESPLWYSNVGGTAGGLAAFLGAVLLLIRPFRKESDYLGIAACAFIAAGISAICGIFLNDVSVSLWLQCQALLLGSLFLSLLWLPKRLARKHLSQKNILVLSLGVSLPVSLWFVFWGRVVLPPVAEDSSLLNIMNTLTMMSGLLFLVALPRIQQVIPAQERRLLFVVVLFLGLGGVCFPFTQLWGSGWWLVQIAQNAPYLLAIGYVLKTFVSSQRALFESEARFRGLFNAAPVGIGIIDNRNNSYWQANPALCRLTGFTESELSNTHLRSIIFPDDVHSSFELRNKLFRGEVGDYCDTRKHLMKDGRVAWVKVRGTLIQLGGNKVQEFRIVEDVTGERVANEKVTSLVEELTRTNEQLERFTSIASHDLRSPLNTVSSYVQLISRRLSSGVDPEMSQFIKFAVEGCARMRSLIEDLLSYARASQSVRQFEPVDLNQVLAEVIKSLDKEIKESGAKIDSPSLPIVPGCRTQLSELFQNLIGNAVKYRGEKPPSVSLNCEEKGGEWHFSVADNGIGFDMEYADKIFVDFQRLNSQSEYGGTGLGLSICKSVVKAHNGNIWVKSSPGVGSTFYFTLPQEESAKVAQRVQMDREYTGPFPRYSGAISAVTGGSPEDMNKMPATLHPETEGPIYDGSSLDAGRKHLLAK